MEGNNDSQENHAADGGAQSSDVSALIPKITIKRSWVIALAVLVLFVIAASVHLHMKNAAQKDEVTRDTPNGVVVSVVEPQAPGSPVPVPPTIVKDKDGKEYMTGELMVEFKPDITIDQAQTIITGAGAKVKQHFTNRPLFLVGISDPGADGVNKAVLKFQLMKEVQAAVPNYLTQGSIGQ